MDSSGVIRRLISPYLTEYRPANSNPIVTSPWEQETSTEQALKLDYCHPRAHIFIANNPCLLSSVNTNKLPCINFATFTSQRDSARSSVGL